MMDNITTKMSYNIVSYNKNKHNIYPYKTMLFGVDSDRGMQYTELVKVYQKPYTEAYFGLVWINIGLPVL